MNIPEIVQNHESALFMLRRGRETHVVSVGHTGFRVIRESSRGAMNLPVLDLGDNPQGLEIYQATPDVKKGQFNFDFLNYFDDHISIQVLNQNGQKLKLDLKFRDFIDSFVSESADQPLVYDYGSVACLRLADTLIFFQSKDRLPAINEVTAVLDKVVKGLQRDTLGDYDDADTLVEEIETFGKTFTTPLRPIETKLLQIRALRDFAIALQNNPKLVEDKEKDDLFSFLLLVESPGLFLLKSLNESDPDAKLKSVSRGIYDSTINDRDPYLQKIIAVPQVESQAESQVSYYPLANLGEQTQFSPEINLLINPQELHDRILNLTLGNTGLIISLTNGRLWLHVPNAIGGRQLLGIELNPLILQNDHISLGRDPNNDFVLTNDLLVSRYHLQISFVGGYLQIKDLQSRNGFKLQYTRISSVY